MLSSVYVGLTGLLSYSRGLDVISNNVANMNTPGFKKSDLLFQNLMFDQHPSTGDGNRLTFGTGQGVAANQTTVNYSQGELRDTNEENAAAIDGNGFFIIRSDSNTYYSRYGGFEIDDDSYLVSSTNNERIAGINGGELFDINIESYREYDFTPTSRVSFIDNLSTGSSEHAVENISVVDGFGDIHDLTINFRNNNSATQGSWLISVIDNTEDATEVGSGEIRFDTDGSPLAEYNTLNIDLAYDDETSNIELFFGEPGSFIGTTSFEEGESSSITVDAVNGTESGALIRTEFNEQGEMLFHYSNGEEQKGPTLALAWFDDLQQLQQIGNSLFLPETEQSPHIGSAGNGLFGNIEGGKIELSNVELTLEFSDLIIIQRGYQASSQILTTSNEIMQQTLDMGSKR